MNVKQKLKTIKRNKGITTKELATLLEENLHAVKKWVSGERLPSNDMMIVIDNVLNNGEIITDKQIIVLAEQVEDFVAGKIDMITFDKKFPDVLNLLVKRHCQSELDLGVGGITCYSQKVTLPEW